MRTPPHYEYLADGLPRPDETKPLLLFLHGKGERGSNVAAVRAHGPPHLYPRYGLDRFLVVSPQCPADEKWDAAKLHEFLSVLLDQHPIDPKRVYLTGISLGGEGGFDLLLRCKEQFAASVLICGRVDEARARALSAPVNPIWLIHSAKDEAVPVSCSDGVYAALQAIGAPVKYTREKSLGHVQTWQRAYKGRELFDWLLTHSLE